MASQIILPKLTYEMQEGRILEWLCSEGEAVSKHQPLFVVETDKAAIEVPAEEPGTLLKILVEAGSTVPVNTPVAWIGASGEAIPEVERAQPMEEVAAPDRVYLGENTAKRVEGYFQLRDLGAFDLKGVRESVHVYELQGIGQLRTRLDVSRARGFSRFVGRAEEMRTLEAALARAEKGNPQIIGIVGEAGVGKSRLCFEFLERCRARGITVHRAQGVAHGKAVPLLPVLEFYREALGIGAHDDDRQARQKIAGGVVLVDEELREALPLFFDFLGVPDPERPAPELGFT